MLKISEKNLSICIYIQQSDNFEQDIKKIVNELNMEETEIFCIANNGQADTIQEKTLHITDKTPNLNDINGKYLLLTDSDNLKNINLSEIYSYEDEDMLMAVMQENDEREENFSHIDSSKTIFEHPKNNMNIYKTAFLKKHSIQLPTDLNSLDNILFYYKTTFSAAEISSKKIFTEIISDDSIESLILNDFKTDDLDGEYSINSEKLFSVIQDVISFFKETNLYDFNKYYVINYIFNLLRNTYRLNLTNKESLFNQLKTFINEASENKTDLILNLTSENLRFYRIIQEVKSINELDLVLKNEEYERESFISHYQLDKFRTVIIDLKNVNTEDNILEMLEFPQDGKSKFILDKFRDSEGSGIRIISYNNSINFKFRCINQGNLTLYVRGMELKDIKAHRMPIMVDLKKFMLNDERLLEESKVISYEKPFKYEKKIEDGEIITINAEWATLSNQSTYQFQNSTNSALLPFDTIRFDIKNYGNEENAVEILSNTDEDSSEYAPEWFTGSDGKGKVIRSSNEKITFKFRCINSGILKVFLRTLDLRDKNRHRIPVQVDLEQVIVNDEVLVEENMLISHDNPYVITKDVKDGDIITVKAEWAPISTKSTYYESEKIRSDLLPFTTARFDIKNIGNRDNNTELISIDDLNSNKYAPAWFTDQYGIGKIIESSKGKINFKIRCINSGKLQLNIRAINFIDTQGFRIPLKIDVKRLIIDGEVIIDENILVSHDNSYKFTKNVNDGDEVDIIAEWAPMSRKSTFFESSKIRTDLLPFTTLRLDLKNMGDKENRLIVVSNDDENSNDYAPLWFNDETGEGRIVESAKKSLNLHLKCVKKGTFTLNLRTIDFKDKAGNRIPLMIDLKSLTINNDTILEENMLISHNDPFEYKKEVIDGELININVEWAPLSRESLYEE